MFEATGNIVRDYHNTGSTCGIKNTPGVEDGIDDDVKGLINFVRGVDTFDQDADNNTTESIHKLADIYHSELIVVGAPEGFNSATGNSNHLKTDSYYRYQNNYNNFKPDLVIHCAWDGGNAYKDIDNVRQFDNVKHV